MANKMGTITANGNTDILKLVPGQKVAVQFFGDTADFDSASCLVKQHRPDLDDGTDYRTVGTAFTSEGGFDFYFTGEPALGIRIVTTLVATAANIGYRVVTV